MNSFNQSRNYFTLLLLVLSISLQATVHRVNNTGADADFTTAQAAHDAASAGDSLYIESSPTSYGNLSITKEIHVFGTGYFLGQNQDLQAAIAPSTIPLLYVQTGADNSTVQGLTIGTVTCGASATVSDIIIERNYIYSGVYLSSSNDLTNVFILRNFIAGSNSTYRLLRTAGAGTKNLVVSNNIMIYTNSWSGVLLDTETTAIFKNNVMNVYQVSTTNSIFKNNILINSLVISNPSANTYSYNICDGTQFPSGNNNMQNVASASIFLGYPTQGSHSADKRFDLSASSPAIGAGEAGIDCGAYDGEVPYILSGIPPIPTIYKLIAPNIVTGNFNITISTRSNN